MFLAICGCGRRQRLDAERGYAGVVRAIADGRNCKSCGAILKMEMSAKSAAKYDVAESPNIIVVERPKGIRHGTILY